MHAAGQGLAESSGGREEKEMQNVTCHADAFPKRVTTTITLSRVLSEIWLESTLSESCYHFLLHRALGGYNQYQNPPA